MREVHGGDCGEDQSQGRLKGKIIHLGYYWPRLHQLCQKVSGVPVAFESRSTPTRRGSNL